MERRKYLLALGSAGAIALSGCLGDDDGVESAAEDFVSAIDSGDHEAVNDMIANDGEMDEWGADDAAVMEELDVEMTEFELLEESDERAEVDMTIRMTNGQTDAVTVTYELRQIDGEWKFWEALEGL